MTLNEWKGIDLTQEILLEIKRRQDWAKERLIDTAGLDPLEDRKLVGVIAAYEDVLNIELEEETNGN